MSDDLDREELEWISEIVYSYRDDPDWNWTQPEWARLQTILDKLDAKLDALP